MTKDELQDEQDLCVTDALNEDGKERHSISHREGTGQSPMLLPFLEEVLRHL